MAIPVNQQEFDRRLQTCEACEFFKNRVCTRGHILQSMLGCPLKRFPGMNGLGYAEVQNPTPAPPGPCGGCGGDTLPKSMSWPEVLAEFYKTTSEWARLGFPLSDNEEHSRRLKLCAPCPHYRHFQCALCKCFVFIKAKLLSAHCVDTPPKW